MRYTVYQQHKPEQDERGNWCISIVPVATIESRSGSQAIEQAKKLPVFVSAHGPERFPIVEVCKVLS